MQRNQTLETDDLTPILSVNEFRREPFERDSEILGVSGRSQRLKPIDVGKHQFSDRRLSAMQIDQITGQKPPVPRSGRLPIAHGQADFHSNSQC
jgi:hypothetical protein